MALTLLEINYTTNFLEFPLTYSYKPTNSINTRLINNIYSNYKQSLPGRTLLFTDIIKLDSSIYPKNKADFLMLLMSPEDYLKFLERELKKKGPNYKISQEERIRRKITEYNLKQIIDKLFNIGSAFNLPDSENSVTIENLNWVEHQYSESKIPASSTHPEITKISILIKLKLNKQAPSSVNMSQLKNMKCNQRKDRICDIYNKLTAKNEKDFKKESYLKKTPKLWKSGGKKNKKKTYKYLKF